ncbi:MAG: fatty acid--CoA ligase family protein, partial [Acidimicrobiia bacterium]|nr:fatty acid--CoA ligase family protein [Acidimicrobiia bacterium]
SPFAMAGHLDDGATAARVTADGYLRTGDLAEIDADGFVWIVGRRSDVVNRSGLKVHPDEVEAVLLDHPGVRDAGVRGVPDARVGEVPWAFVVAVDPGSAPDPADLEAHCRERLAAYKVPARFVLVDTLPRNDAGKLLRRELGDGSS